MFRFIVPGIILLVSIGALFGIAEPAYKDLSALKTEMAAYETALQNAKDLKQIRDDLLLTYNGLSTKELNEIETLLPDSVDNVQLVITVDEIAQRNGLVFKNAKYTSEETDTSGNVGALSIEDLQNAQKPYNTSSLGFTVEGDYESFTAFLGDLEKSLRLVDVTKVGFTSTEIVKGQSKFTYDLEINTYWLKSF